MWFIAQSVFSASLLCSSIYFPKSLLCMGNATNIVAVFHRLPFHPPIDSECLIFCSRPWSWFWPRKLAFQFPLEWVICDQARAWIPSGIKKVRWLSSERMVPDSYRRASLIICLPQTLSRYSSKPSRRIYFSFFLSLSLPAIWLSHISQGWQKWKGKRVDVCFITFCRQWKNLCWKISDLRTFREKWFYIY